MYYLLAHIQLPNCLRDLVCEYYNKLSQEEDEDYIVDDIYHNDEYLCVTMK